MSLLKIISILFVISLLPIVSSAEWSHDPLENTQVCDITGTQRYTVMVTDGTGGVIICWRDETDDFHKLYAQRLDAEGNRLWTANGVEICTYNSNQSFPQIVTDGAGGAIIVWSDYTESSNSDIFAQRLAPDGTRIWAPSGMRVTAATSSQSEFEIVSDDEGGVFVCWTDYRAGADIYAQHLNENGAESWLAHGMIVCGEASSQNSPCLARDGDDGIFIAWRDYRDPSRYDIYAQRVDIDGDVRWTADGVPAEAASQSCAYPEMVSDGSGGAYITFTLDYASLSKDVGISRLAEDGTLPWGWNSPVCSHTFDTYYPDIIGDGAYGAYIVWRDNRDGLDALYAQRITPSGFVLWTANGIPLTTNVSETSDQFSFDLALDTQNGLLVAFCDGRLDNFNLESVFAQRLAPDGSYLWPEEGIEVCTLAYNVVLPTLVADDIDGAVIAWHGYGSEDDIDIYAQRVDAQGALGRNTPAITSITDVPHDQGGQVMVEWTAAYPDRWPGRRITEYSVWVGHPEAPKTSPTRQATVVEPPERLAAFADAGWSYVQVLPALQFEEYACPAWTFGDSIAMGIIPSIYMVIAHTNDPLVYWSSSTAMGYSVDNIVPGAPINLAAAESGPGQARLTWSAGGADEDLSHYAVYRGDASGFPVDPAHRIGTSLTPEFDDDTGGALRWYRVTAVDVHDNESTVSNEAMYTPLTGIEDLAPDAFALRGAVPNPFNPSTRLYFDLPASATISLEVYDAAGRRVAILAEGVWPRGRHAIAWHGCNDTGQAQASGLYFARLRAGTFEAVGRMLLVR